MRQSAYKYRIKEAMTEEGEMYELSVQRRVPLLGWVTVKSYTAAPEDKSERDYIAVCAVELYDNLLADERV